MKPTVSILMGSDSDLETMREAEKVLDSFGICHEIKVLSAHRSPELVVRYVKEAVKHGTKIFIAAAGGAAHLAGVVAAHTIQPVIGVPIPTQMGGGLDSLLSTVQMPSGVPVATVAVGKAGAVNAALLAVQMLSLGDTSLGGKLTAHKESLVKSIREKNVKLKSQLKKK